MNNHLSIGWRSKNIIYLHHIKRWFIRFSRRINSNSPTWCLWWDTITFILLKDIRNQVELKEWWQVLRRKMTGHYNYYGISGNMQGISKFHHNCTVLAYKWINRRSQKKSYNLEQFYCFIKYNPLPKPKIYHSMYALSSWGCIFGEPNAGNPLVC